MILALNIFSVYKLIFLAAAGGFIFLFYLFKSGPWGWWWALVRAGLNSLVLMAILFVLLFPFLNGVNYLRGYPELGLTSNADLKHHTIRKFSDRPIYGYLEHLPPGYDEHPDKKYPLLVFLHGLAEYGHGPDNKEIFRVAKLGPPNEVERLGKLCVDVDGKEECFIVLSPQKSDKDEWSVEVQRNFWHYILHGPRNYRYDPDRIYLSGLSQGSYGVWLWAHSNEPDAELLAGIISVSGRGKQAPSACLLEERGVNVWALHGEDDEEVPVEKAHEEFDALTRCPEVTGAEHIYTIVPDVGHWMYYRVYENNHYNFDPNIYDWMARTKKKYPPVRPEP